MDEKLIEHGESMYFKWRSQGDESVLSNLHCQTEKALLIYSRRLFNGLSGGEALEIRKEIISVFRDLLNKGDIDYTIRDSFQTASAHIARRVMVEMMLRYKQEEKHDMCERIKDATVGIPI